MVPSRRRSPVKPRGCMRWRSVTSICISHVTILGTLEEGTIPAMEAAGRKKASLGLPVIPGPVESSLHHGSADRQPLI